MAKKRKIEGKNQTPSQSEPESAPENEPSPAIKSEPDVELADAEPSIEEREPVEDDSQVKNEPKSQFLPETTKPEPVEATPTVTIITGNNEISSSAVEAQDDDEPEPVHSLVEPLSKNQLIELLCDASARHTDVLDQVRRMADSDPAHRKIFVHGLGWDTSAETLVSAFQQYGEIEDCNAVRDKISGKSKGYGFILFKHRSGARNALKEPQKLIGSRMTSCQLASAGPVPPPAPPVSEYTQRKIYISNVSADVDPQKLSQFFAKYGEIEEGPLGLDKATGKPKGFALFVYKTIDGAKKALEEPHKNFEGHLLHCQKAIDGPKMNKLGVQAQHGTSLLNLQHGSGVGSGAQGTRYQRGDNVGFAAGMGSYVPGLGHMMAPSQGGLGFNQLNSQAAAVAGINPALGQALTALLTTPAAGLTNLLGSLGSTTNQVGQAQMLSSGAASMQGAYGNQAGVGSSTKPGIMGGYGGQAPMQGGYGNASMGQGTAGRAPQGVGNIGGVTRYTPYKGR